VRLLAILLLFSTAIADEPTKPIRLPVIDSQVEPVPVVPPSPKPVTVLPDDHFFVVESDVQLIVVHSPDGLLSVAEDQGPIRLRGKFAGGSGKVESKTFSGKFVYTIEGERTGQSELILVPVGVTSSEQILRAVLSVNGAQPPPKPKPDPQPKPPAPTVDAVHLDIIEDSLNRTVQTATTLNALLAWAAFLDGGNIFRIWDQNNGSDKAVEAKRDLGTTKLPAIIVRDRATRKVIRVMELPESFESLQRVLSELGVK
jgi:hypothetical protein